MKEKGIIALSPSYTRDSIELLKASYDSSLNLKRYQTWNIPYEDRENVIAAYGEDVFVEYVAEQCGLNLLYTREEFLSKLDYFYIKRSIKFLKLKDVVTSSSVFIKPVNFKYFKAGVYSFLTDILGYETLDEEINVFVSDVVNWEFEVRCFILNHEIQTFSRYMKNHVLDFSFLTLNEVENMKNFMNDFIFRYQTDIPKSIVIDVGYIKGRGWAIIETNPVWASGIYQCTPYIKTLEVIKNSAVKL